MDPLSLIASITAVLQLAELVVRCLSRIRLASATYRQLVEEISSVTGLLYHIKGLAADADDHNDGSFGMSIVHLSAPNGPLEQLESSLRRAKERMRSSNPRPGLAITLAAVQPFAKAEVAEIIGVMERQKTLLLLALQGHHM